MSLKSGDCEQSTSPRSEIRGLKRPNRPCDICRKRKSKCVFDQDAERCVLCSLHQQPCTFDEEAAPRPKRSRLAADEAHQKSQRILNSPIASEKHVALNQRHTSSQDYGDLEGDSLLKTTLGLQNHRHAVHIGASAEYDQYLLSPGQYNQKRAEFDHGNGLSLRKVDDRTYFRQIQDSQSLDVTQEMHYLDTIESIVAPHGAALIRLYFRIVHPSFPILHKKVYLEKYARSHREFVPPLLAAVYVLALTWWDYSVDLTGQVKPDVKELDALAMQSFSLSTSRPKLSTVQAGLLLLQRPKVRSPWQLTSQLVAIGQELGLHLDCTDWKIPAWECGLRKRLAWALYMQSCWSALIYGRPLHFAPSSPDWAVREMSMDDFPENHTDEDDEEGSTEVETGRVLFCAMANLTCVLSRILHDLYSARAEAEIASSCEGIKVTLERAKPLQIELQKWYSNLPSELSLANISKIGKLSTNGWLHTSYFAVEMTLHRALLHMIDEFTDPFLATICRKAARERLSAACKAFDQLRPEHTQSFWYFASAFNIAIIGIFAAKCMAASRNVNDADHFKAELQSFRWRLRLSSKNIEFLEEAVAILEASVNPFLQGTSKTIYDDSNGRGQMASPKSTGVLTEPHGDISDSLSTDGFKGQEDLFANPYFMLDHANEFWDISSATWEM